jgi:predicted alpha/beta hydrolase family esterase
MEGVIGAALMAIARKCLADTIGMTAGRLALATVCGVVAAVLVAASVGCAATALWIWEIHRLGSVGAPLVVAAALLVAGLATMATARHALRPRRTSSSSSSDATATALLAEAMHLFREHKASVLMAAFIAGLAAGGKER